MTCFPTWQQFMATPADRPIGRTKVERASPWARRVTTKEMLRINRAFCRLPAWHKIIKAGPGWKFLPNGEVCRR